MQVDRKTLGQFYARETLGSPENAVGFVLWKLVHRFQRAIDRDLSPLDLTHLQFTALAMVGWLNRTQEATTQAELARYADIHVMQISQILTSLEGKGMIVRTVSLKHHRAKCVAITRRGLTTLRRAMPIAMHVQRQLFGKTGAPGGALLESLQSIDTRATQPSGAERLQKKSTRKRSTGSIR